MRTSVLILVKNLAILSDESIYNTWCYSTFDQSAFIALDAITPVIHIKRNSVSRKHLILRSMQREIFIVLDTIVSRRLRYL